MTAVSKLIAFAVVLAVVLAGAAAAGALLDPQAPGGKANAKPEAAGHDNGSSEMNDMTTSEQGKHVSKHSERGTAGEHGSMSMEVRGLAVAQDDLRLAIENPELGKGQTRELRFRIVDDRDRAVRDFDVEHTKRMHLIVVRDDLTGFQHLHPSIDASGTWRTELRLPEPGSYRLFADFSHSGKPMTLAGDLRVDGYANLQALPPPASTATSGNGYEVRLQSSPARAGRESELRFAVTRNGEAVHLEPYLGANGHLVALRDGDQAFLHVHPIDHPHGATDGRGEDSIRFESTFPTAGSYRLFLQFKHEGKVHTAAFTRQVS